MEIWYHRGYVSQTGSTTGGTSPRPAVPPVVQIFAAIFENNVSAKFDSIFTNL